jgi:hypothetical protein
MLSGIMKVLYFFYFVAFPDGEPVPTSPGNALALLWQINEALRIWV